MAKQNPVDLPKRDVRVILEVNELPESMKTDLTSLLDPYIIRGGIIVDRNTTRGEHGLRVFRNGTTPLILQIKDTRPLAKIDVNILELSPLTFKLNDRIYTVFFHQYGEEPSCSIKAQPPADSKLVYAVRDKIITFTREEGYRVFTPESD